MLCSVENRSQTWSSHNLGYVVSHWSGEWHRHLSAGEASCRSGCLSGRVGFSCCESKRSRCVPRSEMPQGQQHVLIGSVRSGGISCMASEELSMEG